MGKGNTMNGAKTLSPERIAEIKAFKNTDFSDCPILTDEELKKLRPRHTFFREVMLRSEESV